jgi:DivIVA domain-containing protein
VPLTPDDIERRTFEVRKRGYDKTQVDRFLGEIANAYRAVLEAGPDAIQPSQQSVPASGEGADAFHPAPIPPNQAPDPALGRRRVARQDPSPPLLTPTNLADSYQEVGAEVAAVLASAQQSADALVHDAEAKVARLRADVEVYAQQVQQEAQRYAVACQADAERDRTEAARLLQDARDQAEAASWAHEEAQRALDLARQRAEAELDRATGEADTILQQAEQAARARVEGILAEADRKLGQASAALVVDDTATSRSERRRPPTSPLRGGRRRTDPPVIDLVRDQDPIIDLVEGAHHAGRAGTGAAGQPGTTTTLEGGAPEGPGPQSDPLATRLSDAIDQAADEPDPGAPPPPPA